MNLRTTTLFDCLALQVASATFLFLFAGCCPSNQKAARSEQSPTVAEVKTAYRPPTIGYELEELLQKDQSARRKLRVFASNRDQKTIIRVSALFLLVGVGKGSNADVRNMVTLAKDGRPYSSGEDALEELPAALTVLWKDSGNQEALRQLLLLDVDGHYGELAFEEAFKVFRDYSKDVVTALQILEKEGQRPGFLKNLGFFAAQRNDRTLNLEARRLLGEVAKANPALKRYVLKLRSLLTGE